MTDSRNHFTGVRGPVGTPPGKSSIRIVKPGFKIVPPKNTASPGVKLQPKLNVRVVANPMPPVAPKLTDKSDSPLLPNSVKAKPAEKGIPFIKREKHPDLALMSLSANRYQIIKVIHEGGFGTVFKVTDRLLKLDVAIKLLKPEISKNIESVNQLKVEAAVAMRLSHENIVRLHNIESERGRIFLVMEFIEGRTLREIIERMGALSFQAVLDIAHACASALTYAHGQGVLHRDIKPENIMITDKMALKLLDFGLAMKLSRGHSKSDFIEGSPGYLSPEQLHGHPLDARSDVFSFAAVVCELLTGQQAFPSITRIKHMYDDEPVGIETLPPSLVAPLQRGLSRDVQSRYSSPAEFYAALEQGILPLLT